MKMKHRRIVGLSLLLAAVICVVVGLAKQPHWPILSTVLVILGFGLAMIEWIESHFYKIDSWKGDDDGN